MSTSSWMIRMRIRKRVTAQGAEKIIHSSSPRPLRLCGELRFLDNGDTLGRVEEFADASCRIVIVNDGIVIGAFDPQALLWLAGGVEKLLTAVEADDLVARPVNNENRARPELLCEIRRREVSEIRANLRTGHWQADLLDHPTKRLWKPIARDRTHELWQAVIGIVNGDCLDGLTLGGRICRCGDQRGAPHARANAENFLRLLRPVFP